MSNKSQLTRSRTLSAWLFVAPMLITLLVVAGWPLIRTIWYGFTDAHLLKLDEAKFIGLDNFFGERGLFSDSRRAERWWNAVWNTLEFAFMSVVIETVLGLVIALVLNASFKARGLVRAAVLIPWAIPTIVSAKMWQWMLNGQSGIVNDLLMKLGLISEPLSWTADPDLVMKSVIMVDVWKTTPFMTLLILAALQMLPSSCYEAAKVDGVHPVKVFFRVTLPLIWPALMVAVIFRFLDAIRIFDLVYVLTPGSRDSMTMSVFVQNQIQQYDRVGYGSAAATLLFLIVGLCTVIYITLGRVKFDGGK